jgi:two-component system chemotaxis response regulator CheB
MGRDGADGLLAMRDAGADTVGQDEATALIYGMPRAAYEIGGVAEQLPLPRIARRVLELCAR